MRKLDRYIALNVISGMAVVLLILVFLESLFSFLAQLDDIRGNYQVIDVGIYTIMMIPRKIYNFIPVSALIGCLVGLGSMASNNELTVIRAAGVSLWRIVWSVMKAASIFIAFGLILGEYIAPATEQVAETQRNIERSLNGEYHGEGAWHKEDNTFMYFNAVEPNGVIYGISQYTFNKDRQLIESSFSKRAILQGDHWILEDTTRSRLEGGRYVKETSVTERWNTSLTKTLLEIVIIKPDALSMSGLGTYINYLKAQELAPGEYTLAFWTKALQPLAIFSLVLVGLSFIFGPLRSVSTGYRVFSGVITSVVFMLAQSILGPSSLVFGFPPILSVLLPIVVCISIGSVLLWKAS